MDSIDLIVLVMKSGKKTFDYRDYKLSIDGARRLFYNSSVILGFQKFSTNRINFATTLVK